MANLIVERGVRGAIIFACQLFWLTGILFTMGFVGGSNVGTYWEQLTFILILMLAWPLVLGQFLFTFY